MKKKQNNRGFSLVELLIAMVILSLIMVSIASFASTTTSTYIRTKEDVKLQQDGNELLNLLSDKIMQAQRIRVGTTHYEYTVSDSASGSKVLKNFYDLDADGVQPGVEDLEYIAVAYDGKVGSAYGTVIDIFYFYQNYVFLFRHELLERPSSTESTDPDLTLDQMEAYLKSYIESDCKAYTDAQIVDLKNEHMICDSIEYYDSGFRNMEFEAYPKDNSVNLALALTSQKSKGENYVSSTITIRNSYVLSPKGYTPPAVP